MSLTITGILTILITQILGENVDEGAVANFLDVGGLLIGALLGWYGRYRHGDINIFGRKL